MFTRYNATNRTVSGSTTDSTNYTINGREIRINNRGHRTVINPNARYPVSSTDERSGLTVRLDGSGRMSINGVPIGPLTEEQQEEEEGGSKTSKKGGSTGKSADEQLVSSTLAEGINIASLIESSYFSSPDERSKLLSLVQDSSIRLAMAALSATSAGNLPLVTLLKEGLSELGNAQSDLNKT